jgi:hypothetical protein
MTNEKILQKLIDNGLPLEIIENVKLFDVSDTMSGDVVFDFLFYGSDARVQYSILWEDSSDENYKGTYEFMYSEVENESLSETFDDFCETNLELLIDINDYFHKSDIPDFEFPQL